MLTMATNHIAVTPNVPLQRTPLKDRWPVLILVPLAVALVPLVNTILEGKKNPSGTTQIHNTNFTGPMYLANISLIEQQYQQTTGQPLNDRDLKKKIEDAVKFAAANNFAAAASILSDVSQSAPVAAVYNNLGIAYANSNDMEH